MEATGNYYLINHLVLITGLTDRTIRNYISNGILHGEKINGLWHFTPEEVESFIAHPAVRPSILAKHHSAVYDFLLEKQKRTLRNLHNCRYSRKGKSRDCGVFLLSDQQRGF